MSAGGGAGSGPSRSSAESMHVATIVGRDRAGTCIDWPSWRMEIES